jgi:Flp pilus assembly protein TadB
MDDPVAADQALAWQWFALHSGQRMQLVNFWLVSTAFLVAAFVQAKIGRLSALAIGVAALGVIASLAFQQLDERTRRLIRIAEAALLHIENARLEGKHSRARFWLCRVADPSVIVALGVSP